MGVHQRREQKMRCIDWQQQVRNNMKMKTSVGDERLFKQVLTQKIKIVIAKI